MIISHRLKAIFIHVHKCGGTSIEKALEPFLGWNDLLLGSTKVGELINDYYAERYGLHKHSSLMDVYRVAGNQLVDSYFKFALVRNPISRICSLYNFVSSIVNEILVDKQITIGQLREEYEFRKVEHPELQWFSVECAVNQDFDQFIRNRDLAQCDKALWPQATFLMVDDYIGLDKYYRLEDLDASLADIEARLGIEFQVRHDNQSTIRLVKPNDLAGDDIKHIRSMYKDDFSLFGY